MTQKEWIEMAAKALKKAHEMGPFPYVVILENEGNFHVSEQGSIAQIIGLIETARVRARCEFIDIMNKPIKKTEGKDDVHR